VDDERTTVAIVGGGCAGALTAVALLRAARRPIDVVIVEPRARLGEGVAYSTEDERHVLNVPAGRHSARSDDPEGFHRWASRERPGSTPEDFHPRGAYGRYLRSELAAALEYARDLTGSTLSHTTGRVRRIDLHDSGRARVGGSGSRRQLLSLEDGSAFNASAVVLAIGPPPPSAPAELPVVEGIFVTPWQPGALAPLDGGTVLLVGNGPTAVDAALTIGDEAPATKIVAISRTGWEPRAHLEQALAAREAGVSPVVAPPDVPDGPIALDQLEAAIRGHIRASQSAGYDWRAAFDGLRPIVPALWRRLTVEDQRRFLRDLAREWDVHRHRMAPRVAARLQALRAAGRFEQRIAGIGGVERHRDGLAVTLRGHPAGNTGTSTVRMRSSTLREGQLVVQRIINCTGPGMRITAWNDPLVRQLLDEGRAAPDALEMGLRANDDGAIVSGEGIADPSLFVLGSLRRGELWESTAVAEIRAQAERIAPRVAG